MVKLNNHNNPQAAEFTDYTIAGTKQGQVHAAISRAVYQQERDYIRTRRSLRRMCQQTANPCRTEGDDVRCGYPKRRQRNEDIPSHRGVPHSGFLKRFKIVDRITFERTEENFLGEFIHKAKVYVLHATRGWKLYA